jgi:Nuclease subunit of the excinuclease complex
MTDKLREKLKGLPKSPGVYFHKNTNGDVIYVGKAAVLKNRVRQYFQSRKDMDPKTLALVKEITDTDWIETESEIDALFLESEMIKRYKPKWNILLRDDKSQTYVRINIKDDWPFVSYTRQPLNDGAEYIGPFYNKISLREALRFLRKTFPFYTHERRKKTSKLSKQIGLEPTDKITSQEYKKSLRQLISYVKGNRIKVVAEIEKEMENSASRQQFEQAAELRNKLFNLKELKKQGIFSREDFIDASRDQSLRELQDLVGLESIPRRIEGYDVSHHGGKNNTGSMVVISNGVADKSQYRKFRLRSGGNDDYKQMREIIERRLKHLSGWGRPDVIMIDGGKGQLSAVSDLLIAEKIAFIGRVKSGDHTRNAKVIIVLPNGKEKHLESNSHLAKLIARLDDEAHRFAISYHTLLKRKNMLK